jgi:hypothetical protein
MRGWLAILPLTVFLCGCWVTQTEIVGPKDSLRLAGVRLTMTENGESLVHTWNDARAGYLAADGSVLLRFARLKGEVYLVQYQPLQSTIDVPELKKLPPVYMLMHLRLASPNLVAQSCFGDRQETTWLARSYGVETDERRENVISGTREAIIGFLTGMIDCRSETMPMFTMTSTTISPGGRELASIGTTQDQGRLVKHFERRCDAGEADACFTLAQRLQKGDGVPADPSRAAAVFDKLCQAQRADACADLAVLYERGEGVTKDPARAAALLKQACGMGEMYACDLMKRKQP